MPEPISDDMALRLCQAIRLENRGRWYSFYGMWCWGCHKFTKADPKKLCFANRTGNRGCSQVNKRYDDTKPP